MIKYFVIPRLGELFYSIVARYQNQIKVNSYRIAKSLFGVEQIQQNLLFPSRLEEFENNVGKHFSLPKEHIIEHHSIVPLYLKFVPPSKRDSFLNNAVRTIDKRQITLGRFKYCAVCFQENYDAFGEPYWNREHNIPNVQLCLKHDLSLNNWTSGIEKIGTRRLIPATEVSGYYEEGSLNRNSILKDVTQRTVDAILSSESFDHDAIVEKGLDINLLIKKGSRIEFNKSFDKKILDFVAPLIKTNNELDDRTIMTGVKNIFHKPHSNISPYIYFCLERFIIEMPAKQKLNSKHSFKCINSLCENFDTNKGITFKSTPLNHQMDRGAQIYCSQCGMEYLADVKIKGRLVLVINYGNLTFSVLKKHHQNSMSFRQMEQYTGIDRKIISKILSQNTSSVKITFSVPKTLISERRNIWLKELSSVSFFSISKSSKKLKTEYRWLLKHDGNWLKEINKNYRLKKFEPREFRDNPIKAEDDKILALLQNNMDQLIKKNIDRQISKTILLKLKPFEKLTNTQLLCLPKTSHFLENRCETKFEFRKRMILKFLEGHQDHLPQRYQVIEKFKITYPKKYNLLQKKELLALLKTYY